jgi:hypothetical protein
MGGKLMSGPVNQMSNVIGANNYQWLQLRSADQPVFGEEKDTAITSSKYVIVDNSISYERYDRYGKLISRVPWTAHPIDEKV